MRILVMETKETKMLRKNKHLRRGATHGDEDLWREIEEIREELQKS